jgi:uncharacterized protein (UPF0332 family)
MMNDDIAVLVRYRLDQADTALQDGSYLLAGQRSAQSVVNRAYYAMFYAALAALQTTGKTPNRHTGVVALLDTEFILKGLLPRELSRDFHRAFELRQVSDYRVTEQVSVEQAGELLGRAGEFVAAVRKLLLT